MHGQIGLDEGDELFNLVWMKTFFELFDESVQLDDALRSMIDDLEPFGSVESQRAPFGL